ncbi:aspartate aminotransferase family protein [bacterium]|nr:aspartate aminotransferase family protein [bacterium]
MTNEEILQLTARHVAPTYNRFSISMAKGKGCLLWDTEGKEYLDFISGLGVNNIGHSHSFVVDAIKRQAENLIHVSNLFHIPQQAQLAKEIVKRTFQGKVFFANSGAEANEAAIKLARKYGQNQMPGKIEIITAYNSFHGRTLATITATAQEKYQKGFHPLLPGFVYTPYNDISAMEAAITDKTCAVMIEPIQGEGGVNVPSPEYLPCLRRLCDRKGVLLILDEVQTGIGRTGRLFNYQYYDIRPDIITMAKSLGGGVPIGAMLARDDVIDAFIPGSHASTFGGNYLASAAGLAVLEVIDKEGMLENCVCMSDILFKELMGLKGESSVIKEVRGKGLMIGMELHCEGREIVKRCLAKGLIINCTMDNVLRLLPPLIITRKEIDRAMEVLSDAIKDFQG